MFEELDETTPESTRSVALRAASLVGVRDEVIEEMRAVDVVGDAMTAAEWLRCTLDVDRLRRRDALARAAGFGAGTWAAIYRSA